jgi:hypothetical protein
MALLLTPKGSPTTADTSVLKSKIQGRRCWPCLGKVSGGDQSVVIGLVSVTCLLSGGSSLVKVQGHAT